MKKRILITAVLIINSFFIFPQKKEAMKTYCNPVNIDYRFMIDEPCRREAADPVIVLFGDLYFLFASKSGGYWYSKDMSDWVFIEPKGLPIEDYAPAIEVIKNKMYFTAVESCKMYETEDPLTGIWKETSDIERFFDPAMYRDDDGKFYMYSGCGQNDWITAFELNPDDKFKVTGQPVKCFTSNVPNHGWERRGDDNLGVFDANGKINPDPWIEGAWMTKHNGVYYLQYAAPGTEFKGYGNGVYTSPSPKGPFKYADYSPISFKPTGFITGAGHGCTFLDKDREYWQIQTMVISVAHMFERRLGLFPSSFDSDGQMRVNTYLGDFPHYLPGRVRNPIQNSFTGWMLLSYNKNCQASSTNKNPIKGEINYIKDSSKAYLPQNAFDEDVKTYWCAETGNNGEWLSVDLGKECRVNAIQVNFAECGMKALGRQEILYQQYLIEISADGKTWEILADKSSNKLDRPHEYIELDKPATARFVRIKNIFVPAGGKFSIRGFRIFGNGLGSKPSPVKDFSVSRNSKDQRQVVLKWNKQPDATGYVVRYGIAADKLCNNYQVYDKNEIAINSLNNGVEYFFTIDSFNENGVCYGEEIKQAKNTEFK